MKVLIPAAGLGKRMRKLIRFLPKDKPIPPKEMLEIGKKLMIDYALREAKLAGFEKIGIIVNPKKKALIEYLHSIVSDACIFYQQKPTGLAEAIFLAKDFIRNESFAVILPDNIFLPKKGFPPAIKQILNVYKKYKKNTVGLIRISSSEAKTFGNCGRVKLEKFNRVYRITELGDKREGYYEQKEEWGLRTFARYILKPEFFDYILWLRKRVQPGEEVDDVPILQRLAKEGKLIGVILKGKGFDAGNLRGYFRANLNV